MPKCRENRKKRALRRRRHENRLAGVKARMEVRFTWRDAIRVTLQDLGRPMYADMTSWLEQSPILKYLLHRDHVEITDNIPATSCLATAITCLEWSAGVDAEQLVAAILRRRNEALQIIGTIIEADFMYRVKDKIGLGFKMTDYKFLVRRRHWLVEEVVAQTGQDAKIQMSAYYGFRKLTAQEIEKRDGEASRVAQARAQGPNQERRVQDRGPA